MFSPLDKYSTEIFPLRDGLYSGFDSRYLYSVVREYKPKTIVEFGPRQGRTTSCIINAIIKNLSESDDNIKYYIFDKDVPFLEQVRDYVDSNITNNSLQNKIQVSYNENIIDAPILNEINNIDLLFIDANHDYILAKWYIEYLFPKVKIGGIIHIHDIYYDKNNNGWFDSRMSTNREQHTHPDYTDIDTMKKLYPTIFDKYYEDENIVMKHESDIIEEFYLKNQDNVEMYSTLQISRNNNQFHDFNCSMYFKINNQLC